MTDVKEISQFLRDTSDRLLDSMNLARRRSGMAGAFQGLGFFAAGAIVGGGLALLFAPSSGAELRRSIAGFFSRTTKKVVDGVEHQVSVMEGEGGASKPGSRSTHHA